MRRRSRRNPEDAICNNEASGNSPQMCFIRSMNHNSGRDLARPLLFASMFLCGLCGNNLQDGRVPSLRSGLNQVLTSLQHGFNFLQIFFRIHANGVVRRLSNVDINTVVQKSQLLQPLRGFQL